MAAKRPDVRVAQILCSGHYAGAERVACELTRALAPVVELSKLYLILEARSGEAACRSLTARIDAFGLDYDVHPIHQPMSLALMRTIVAACRRDSIDIVHSHSYKAACFISPILKAAGAVRRSVFTLHGMGRRSRLKTVHVKSLVGAGALLSDAVIGCARPITTAYSRIPTLAGRMETIPNGIDVDAALLPPAGARSVLAQRYDLDPDAIWIGAVGRLAREKDLPSLLRAIADLRSRVAERRVQLLIVGEGPERDGLVRHVADLGLRDTVIFAGHVDAIADVYAALDILALTSVSEGTPMAVLEAMAYGVPVVASAVGGVPDMVEDGTTGLLFPAGDVARCSDQLLALIAAPALRRRLSDCARQRVLSRYGIAQWAERHVSLYRRLLAASG
ncbi:MAG: glycosyltransferase [Rhodospirillales bacterium]|nr:glycosyltransferase [Rhodospirillales bacterium]